MNIGDKEYIVEHYGSEGFLVRLAEVKLTIEKTTVARCATQDSAHTIAQALNERHGY